LKLPAAATTDYGNLAGNLEVGYTFDATIQPRIYLGGAYFGGDADADDLSFNRLFSNWEYSEFIENTELSNAWLLRAGVSIMPTESREAGPCRHLLPG
jgi:hypothetical protein